MVTEISHGGRFSARPLLFRWNGLRQDDLTQLNDRRAALWMCSPCVLAGASVHSTRQWAFRMRADEESRVDPQKAPLAFDFDAYRPEQIAARVETAGLAKVRQPVPAMLMLSVLAGAYIAVGALFYTIVVTGSDLG
jgi:hypothetical protein